MNFVSRLEATNCGCFPLVPNILVYPEIYPKQCLYKDGNELYEKLVQFCKFPERYMNATNLLNMNLQQYSIDYLLPQYLNIFQT